MSTLSQVRRDLGTRLQQIPSLAVYDRIPGMIDPPAVVVGFPDPAEYNMTYGPTGFLLTIPVRLYVGRADDDAAQDELDAYIAPTGSRSIKQAVEDESITISSGWHAVTVSSCAEFGSYRVGDVDLLGCEFRVEVATT